MKKVLIVGESPLMASRFGSEIRNLGMHFHNRGIETACFACNYTGWPLPDNSIPYPLYPWAGPPDKPENIDDVLDEFCPDTLLLIGPPVLFHWMKNYRRRKKYHIVLHTAFRSSPLSSYMKEVYGIADRVVVNSLYEESILKSELPDASVTPISPGIDGEGLKSSRISRDVRDGKFRVACVAKDIPQMDFPALLKAFGIAAKVDPRLYLGIFSDASQFRKWNLPDMVDVYGIKERCAIINPQPELNFGFPRMGDLYASIDLLVLPHQEEALDTTALEANYCGVPMILPNDEHTREFMPGNGGANYLEKHDIFIEPPSNTRYRIFDPEEIAEKLLVKLLELSQSMKVFPKRKYNKNLERFDWKKVSREWVDILE